jgi:hypothetical protein
MGSIVAEYRVCKGTVCLAIQWVEDTLVKDWTFALPGKRVRKRKSAAIEYIVVDVTESPINRAKKNQKEYYSGKKTTYNKNAGNNRAGQPSNHWRTRSERQRTWFYGIQRYHRERH